MGGFSLFRVLADEVVPNPLGSNRRRKTDDDAPRPGRALQSRDLRLATLEPERARARQRRRRPSAPLVVRRQRLGPASHLRIFFFFSQGNQQGLAYLEVVVVVVVEVVMVGGERGEGGEKEKRNTRTVSAALPSTEEEERKKHENVRNKLLSDPYFYRPGFNRAGPGPGPGVEAVAAAAAAVSKG